MNSVLRPVDNYGHIGRTYLENKEQTSWSQNELLKCYESSSLDKNIEIRCSAKYAKFTNFLLLSVTSLCNKK